MAHLSHAPVRSVTRVQLALCMAVAFFQTLCSATAAAHAYCAYVANGQSGTVSVIDTATNKVVTSIDVGKYPEGIAIAPDGRSAYVANNHGDPGGNTITIVDTRTNTVTGTIPVCTADAPPWSVAVAPNGSLVATCPGCQACPNSGSVWFAGTVLPIGGGQAPFSVAVTPDGNSAYVSNVGGGTVSVIDTGTITLLATPVPVGNAPAGIAINPDGRYVYVANSEDLRATALGTVSVIDTTKVLADPSHAVTATIAVGNNPFGIAITPDGHAAYVTNMQGPLVALPGTVSVIDTIKVFTDPLHAVTATIPVGNSPFGVAVTPDGRFAYVTNSQAPLAHTSTPGDVSVIDTGKVLTAPADAVTATIPVGNNPSGIVIASVPEVCPESPAPCVGDCGNDGAATVDELLTMVNIALGSADAATCTAGDANHDGHITIDEILSAVNNALNGGLDVTGNWDLDFSLPGGCQPGWICNCALSLSQSAGLVNGTLVCGGPSPISGAVCGNRIALTFFNCEGENCFWVSLTGTATRTYMNGTCSSGGTCTWSAVRHTTSGGAYYEVYGAQAGDYSLTTTGHTLIGRSSDGNTFDVSGYSRFIIYVPATSSPILFDAFGLDTHYVNSQPGAEYAHYASNMNPTGSSWSQGDSYIEGPPDGLTIENTVGRAAYYGFTTEGASTLTVYLKGSAP